MMSPDDLKTIRELVQAATPAKNLGDTEAGSRCREMGRNPYTGDERIEEGAGIRMIGRVFSRRLQKLAALTGSLCIDDQLAAGCESHWN
jgi:hypothetical protein